MSVTGLQQTSGQPNYGCNIGPVTEALADALAADRVIVCPAFPGTGRSLYQGHLFVDDRLLNESGMQNHPLTPMTDADIRRWLRLQVDSAVGHVPAATVFEGAAAIRQALAQQRDEGCRLVVVDAIRDEDLLHIGAAADDLRLVTGGSGVAMGLPANFRSAGLIDAKPGQWRGENGACVALCGSCSQTTRRQVAQHRREYPALAIDPLEVASGRTTVEAATAWALEQDTVPLLYSSADPETVAGVQRDIGRDAAANLLESFFTKLARRLVGAGVRRLLVAGGETSGAVVEGLGLDTLEIGPQIDPGVPALRAGPGLVLALKSGNFGADDYFARAADVLAQDSG